ncbi:hypothetical protein [Crateriforma spongiae]|uniref:hypothetical protein n=1 Tax=Crateriforma spongiae TaxID=2724528 RepID=UPI0039AF7B85
MQTPDPRQMTAAAQSRGLTGGQEQTGLAEANGKAVSLDVIQAQGTITELRMELNRMQRTIRLTIQARLRHLQGQSCDTLEANQALATELHELLDSQGLRVQCSECGHPAILRVSPRKGSPRGAFVFDHTINGRRTFHGGAGTIPELRLVAKPKRAKAARREPK